MPSPLERTTEWPWLLPYTRPAGEPASALEALVISSAADLCEIGLHSELRPLPSAAGTLLDPVPRGTPTHSVTGTAS